MPKSSTFHARPTPPVLQMRSTEAVGLEAMVPSGEKPKPKRVVVAPVVAGVGGDARQQVEARHLELRGGGRLFHALLAVVGLVLDGARGSFGERERTLDGLLALEHLAARVGGDLLALFGAELLGGADRTAALPPALGAQQ